MKLLPLGWIQRYGLGTYYFFQKNLERFMVFFFKFYFGVGGDQGKTVLFKKTVLHLDYICYAPKDP